MFFVNKMLCCKVLFIYISHAIKILLLQQNIVAVKIQIDIIRPHNGDEKFITVDLLQSLGGLFLHVCLFN